MALTIVETLTVTGGVDTHADAHVAAALDHIGGLLGVESFATTPAGYGRLLAWLRSFGPVGLVGVEGTGSYGAGLTRHLVAAGIRVVEVDRSDRQARYRSGKSDPLDAESAARAALSGKAKGEPRGRDGTVEAIRALMVAKRSARAERTRSINQARSLVVTGPDDIRPRFRTPPHRRSRRRAGRPTPRVGDQVGYATRIALRELGRRAEYLAAQIDYLDGLLLPLVEEQAPSLLEMHGTGPHIAAILIIAAGDHPDRLRSEAAWAHLCAVSDPGRIGQDQRPASPQSRR